MDDNRLNALMKIYQRLRIFVSSKMQELAPEREIIKETLRELNIDAWLFEEDAGAQSHPIKQSYEKEIDNADLYIGLFWRDYGEYTIEEFNYATGRKIDCLIYQKQLDIEENRDSKLQAFLDKISDVETGLTVQWFQNSKELQEGLKRDVTRWQTQKIRALRKLNYSYRSIPLEVTNTVDLRVLLERVKHFWVKGVLEQTIKRANLLEISKDTQPDSVGNPWEAVIELPFEGSRAVPLGKNIDNIFDDLEHSMLILGQPGSGKTTTLITLVRELIMRSERNPDIPIPVIFHLSSWTNRVQNLSVWLADELNDKYQIPRKIGEDWLRHQRLLLLFDGLDEVTVEHRDACVVAINQFVKEVGLYGIVVCCRFQEYEDLKVKLNLNGAICLRPLTNKQIDSYVAQAGAALAGLRKTLKHDTTLQKMARSPLMLNLLCITYRGHEAESLAGNETMDVRTRRLFSAYIDLKFKKRGTTELRYPKERALEWLTWIAKQLSEDKQALFLIEDLQPRMLSNGFERIAYMIGISVGIGLVMGLSSIFFWGAGTFVTLGNTGITEFLAPREWILWIIAMPVYFLALSYIESLKSRTGEPLLNRLRPGLHRGVFKGFISICIWILTMLILTPLVNRDNFSSDAISSLHLLWSGIVIAFLMGGYGHKHSISHNIKTTESLRWSAKKAWRGSLTGLLSGLVIGFFGIVFLLGEISLIPIIGFGVIGMCLGGLFSGLVPSVKDTRTKSNQGIRLSFKMAVFMALNAIWLVSIAIIIAEYSDFIYKANPIFTIEIPMLGNFIGLTTVLFLWYGGMDVIKHYVLRMVLSIGGRLPWRLTRFLNQACKLDLMQNVGNAYQFVHRLLQQHLTR